ncbi:MAG: phosphate signaling complex protein PhoU [Thiolinea sp.]
MPVQHTLKPFEKKLHAVQEKVTGMAEMVNKELADSLHALQNRNQDEAVDVAAEDVLIDASERVIDELVIQTIALHQPMATDCRLLVAALRIAKDLERIGDYAANIANHSATLDQLEPTGEERRVHEMGQAVQGMMNDVITAYMKQDEKAATVVRGQDEQVDKQYTQIFANLIAISTRQPDLSAACTHLTFVARSLERIGDHITDIAEEIIFVTTGSMPEQSRIKADGSASVKA